jgi:membrane dipeptidase
VTAARASAQPPRIAVADAHNDLLLELAFRRGEDRPFARHWLPQLQAGGLSAVVCAVYAGLERLPESALRAAVEQVAACHRAVGEHPEEVGFVRTAHDLARARDQGRLALLLAMEGAEPLGYDPALVDVFWELGVRVFGLTWNRRNPFADGLGEPQDGGLSALGRQLVARLEDLGAILDLAHASRRTFSDVFDHPSRPAVLLSHAGCRAVYDSPRNVDDDQLAALGAADGVLGVMGHPSAVDPDRPTLDRLIDHIVHAASVIGVDRVAIGADFSRQILRSGAANIPPDVILPKGMALDAVVDGFAGPDDYPRLAEHLRRRGFKDAEVRAVLGENIVRLLLRALPE